MSQLFGNNSCSSGNISDDLLNIILPLRCQPMSISSSRNCILHQCIVRVAGRAVHVSSASRDAIGDPTGETFRPCPLSRIKVQYRDVRSQFKTKKIVRELIGIDS